MDAEVAAGGREARWMQRGASVKLGTAGRYGQRKKLNRSGLVKLSRWSSPNGAVRVKDALAAMDSGGWAGAEDPTGPTRRVRWVCVAATRWRVRAG